MLHDHSNKNLLVAIDEFRNWNVEPWDLNWAELMFFFENACREYALDKLYEQWFSDEEAVDLIDSPRGYQLYVDYLSMYLCD
jgi:hypothetical protein